MTWLALECEEQRDDEYKPERKKVHRWEGESEYHAAQSRPQVCFKRTVQVLSRYFLEKSIIYRAQLRM